MAKKHSIGIICVVADDSIDISATLESVLNQNKPDCKVNLYLGINKNCTEALNTANQLKENNNSDISIEISVFPEFKTLADSLVETWKKVNDEYVVLCPASEVFSDENYLISQYNAIVKDTSVSAVFCTATDLRDGFIIPYNIHKLRNEGAKPFDSTLFATNCLAAYSSLMIKNRNIDLPAWCTTAINPFYPLILILLGKSKIKLNDATMVEKRAGFKLFPLEKYSEGRIEIMRLLRLYFKETYGGYCTGTLKKAILNEVAFAISEIANGCDIKKVFCDIKNPNNHEYAWLRNHIEKYQIEEKQIWLTGNLHKEWAILHNKPMVTVVCITYAHENFIRQALDSFVCQKTNFKYQIFVGEDKGPDKTADIIREYARKYPDLIVPFIRETNMGAQRNLIDMCNKAQTPYIAFCEGDDYWTDEYKLQKQFDYMESKPTLRSCFHDAEIKVDMDESWFLAEQFKSKNENSDLDDRMIWPRYMKGFKPKNTYSAKPYIKQGFVHTSSMFFRWDYFIEIPEWYYTHQLGDFTIWLIQLGKGRFGYIQEIMSVYRRHEGGAYYFKNKMQYMLKTRQDWISLLKNLRDYFAQNYLFYQVDTIQNRINKETNNLFYYVINNMDYETFHKTVEETGEEGYQVVRWVYRMRYANKDLINSLPDNIQWYIDNVDGAKEKLENTIAKIQAKTEKKQNRDFIFNYWKNSLAKKDRKTWVFTGFRGDCYMDNTMYLFEYVSDNHPEINAVWISTEQEIVDFVNKNGRKAYLSGTPEAISTLRHAYLGVIDHYKMSDFGRMPGFNFRMNIVQLWHGVGNKKMVDVVELSTVEGSQTSPDILIKRKDSLPLKLLKRLRLLSRAPYRELFERYLMYVCPGEEMVNDCKKALNIPKNRFFLCGYPRTSGLYNKPIPTKNIKIIYAPTYRWSSYLENTMINELITALPVIQKTMEQINGEFVIRLHPHTWRDYNYKLKTSIKKQNRIKIDKTKDIYKEMSNYFAMISDYSSIIYDFLLMDRPMIFHCPDLEVYVNSDQNLKYPYEKVSPGAQTKSWEETMNAVLEYVENPQKDSEERLKVRDFFYDMTVNDQNNSERIVNEIKRRINF